MARIIDLGCGSHRDPTATDGLDFYAYPGVTVVHDLTAFPWPIPDATYDAAVSHQVLEHLPRREEVAGTDLLFQFFDEAWRILKPGGTLAFDVPESGSADAHADLTHRRFFSPRAFGFLWTPDRDPGYRRSLWTLLSLRVDREYGWGWLNAWHLRKYAPRVDRWLCDRGVGRPRFIYVVLRKPA